MALNKGYLTADSSKASDETFTPAYAVKPIIKYIKEGSTIWCPFDEEENSEYVKELRAAGFKVIATHIFNGEDFMTYEPEEEYDVIISNPPFSIKDDILHRLTQLDKPYAMLLPLPTLQGQDRFDDLIGCQALIFDKRINYYRDRTKSVLQDGASFASIYICKNFLPKDLVFEKLNK